MLYGLFTNMRIALIIFPIHASHGCILQTYALYRTLRKLGHDVSIIDRQWDKLSLKNQLVYAVKSLIISIKRKCIRPLTIEGTRKIIMSELQTFVDKHLSNRKIYFRTPRYEELPHYDAFIVGSDQTWRPKYVSDILYYYLCFVPAEEKVKRIAYAPSFGTEEWEYSEQQTLQCRELVSRFDAIAVREDSGAKLCGKYLGINVEHNAGRIFGGKTIRISNGIDFDAIPLKQNRNNTSHELHLIGVAEVHISPARKRRVTSVN